MKYLSQLVSRIIETDFLVIGGGLAGSFAGAILGKKNIGRVVLVEKSRVGASGQTVFLAGNWALKPNGMELDEHTRASIELGEYMNDPEWTRLLWKESESVTKLLDRWCEEVNLPAFQKEGKENFEWFEARDGNIRSGYIHFNGRNLLVALRKHLLKSNNVQVIERTQIQEFVCNPRDGRVVGAVGLETTSGDIVLVKSRYTIIAASGCGFKSAYQGYQNLTGDLQAAAFRAGISLRGLEFVFSSIGAKDHDIQGLNLLARVVGGKLVNGLGEEFIDRYDPVLRYKSNLKTIILASAIEVSEGRGPIYLDLTHVGPEERKTAREKWPREFAEWDLNRVDPFSARFEWMPYVYGTLAVGGGIHVNARCETNIPGVYAAGDVTAAPAQGTYGYSGGNVLFAAVSGKVAAENAEQMFKQELDHQTQSEPWEEDVEEDAFKRIIEMVAPLKRKTGLSTGEAIENIQRIIIPYDVSLVKDENSLKVALERAVDLHRKIESDLFAVDVHDLVKANEARNMILLARLMIESAILRRESRGLHLRKDHPKADNDNWLKWVFVRRGSLDNLDPSFSVVTAIHQA